MPEKIIDIDSPKLNELPLSISMYCAEFDINPKVKQRINTDKGTFMVLSINYANNHVAYGQI